MRINVKTYSIVIPWTTTKKYSQAKLKRWGVAIIWSAPPLEIGEQLGIKETLHFRLQHLLDLKHQYEWKVVGPGRIQGTPQGEEIKSNENVIFTQQLDGIHWRLEKQHANGGRIQEDRNKLESIQDEGGVVFCAHPLIHGFPWFVPDTVKNKNVVKALKKQPFKKFKGVGVGLTTMIATLKTKAESQRWIAAGLQQTPTELWAHKNELTDYQVWVVYRGVTNQLNLYHAERATDSSCRKTTECAGAKETLEHLFWQCPSAQACWKKLISQWTGEQHDQASMEAYMQYCASRKAPSLPKDRKMDLYVYEPDDEADMETMWKRIWRIASSICITSLWIQRNRVIFEQQEISSDQAMQEFWSSCMRQLRAIAKRERRQTNTRISGTRLQLGTQLLQQKPRETPSKVETRELMQNQKELALLARLQAFQTSCLR